MLNKLKIFGNFRNLTYVERLNREGLHSIFWFNREGLIREGGFIDRGLNRAFTVTIEEMKNKGNVAIHAFVNAYVGEA